MGQSGYTPKMTTGLSSIGNNTVQPPVKSPNQVNLISTAFIRINWKLSCSAGTDLQSGETSCSRPLNSTSDHASPIVELYLLCSLVRYSHTVVPLHLGIIESKSLDGWRILTQYISHSNCTTLILFSVLLHYFHGRSGYLILHQQQSSCIPPYSCSQSLLRLSLPKHPCTASVCPSPLPP